MCKLSSFESTKPAPCLPTCPSTDKSPNTAEGPKEYMSFSYRHLIGQKAGRRLKWENQTGIKVDGPWGKMVEGACAATTARRYIAYLGII